MRGAQANAEAKASAYGTERGRKGSGVTEKCRQCGSPFNPSPRAGRNSHRRKDRNRSLTAAQFCSARCRQANYRWRRGQDLSAVTRASQLEAAARDLGGKRPTLPSAVTHHSQDIDSTGEKTTKNEGAQRLQIAGPELSDSAYHCATLPLDQVTAETVRKANRKADHPYLKKNLGAL
jgi:hypothetical protein